MDLGNIIPQHIFAYYYFGYVFVYLWVYVSVSAWSFMHNLILFIGIIYFGSLPINHLSICYGPNPGYSTRFVLCCSI